MSEHNEDETRPVTPKRAMVFDFEADELDKEPEFIDNTDTTDYVAKAEKSRKTKKAAIIAAFVILIGFIGYGIYYIITNDANSHLENPDPTPTVTTTETTEPSTTNHPTDTTALNPISDSYPDAPQVTTGEEVIAVINTNIIASSNGKALMVATPATAEPSKTECKVNKPTDFCLAGIIKFNDTLTTDVYYMKDAAHSRLFEKHDNFEQQQITGAATSAILDITLSGTKTVIVAVADNSSGFMIVMPDNSTPTDTQTVIDNIAIAEQQ